MHYELLELIDITRVMFSIQMVVKIQLIIASAAIVIEFICH